MIRVHAEAARNINIVAEEMRNIPRLEYIIVLGAHVEGTRLTLALLERTRRALKYLQENPETKAVLSGGKGTGEAITEAQAMYHYLTEHGIKGERLILEERSTSTAENLKFSLDLIGLDHSVGVVTNHFHVFRGTAIGRKCGCREIYPIPSRYRSWRLLIYIPPLPLFYCLQTKIFLTDHFYRHLLSCPDFKCLGTLVKEHIHAVKGLTSCSLCFS